MSDNAIKMHAVSLSKIPLLTLRVQYCRVRQLLKLEWMVRNSWLREDINLAHHIVKHNQHSTLIISSSKHLR